jgi:hypothetical protein
MAVDAPRTYAPIIQAPVETLTDAEKLQILWLTIFGSKHPPVRGIVDALADIEKVIAEYKRLKLMLQGALVFMGLSTVTNMGTLYALFKSIGLIP